MTPLAGLCIGFAFARARLASLGYQSYVLNNLFAATLFSARFPDALHLLQYALLPPRSHTAYRLFPWLLLAAFGCSWLPFVCSWLFLDCFLAFGRLPGIAPGAILKSRFREGVCEPLENDRFGMLSDTFWSIGVNLVAGAGL